MQMRKRNFCLSVQRKNHERKRWGYYPVRIPIKGGISVFKVAVPLSAHLSDQRTALLAQPPTTQPPIRSSSTQTPLLNSLLSSSSEPVITTCMCMSIYIHVYMYIYLYGFVKTASSARECADAPPRLLRELRSQLLCSNLAPGKLWIELLL